MRRLAATALAVVVFSGGAVAAADLPAAPEPVDYVRVCDAGGNSAFAFPSAPSSGFLYVPGTDTCTRVAGRVRGDFRLYGSNEAFGGPGWYSNHQPGYVFRARAYLYADTRTPTEYGLLRTYSEIWITNDTNAPTNVFVHNAQIQFAGLTAGRTASFYDVYFGNTFNTVFKLSGTADPDFAQNLLGYSLAFGSGFSASLSLEDAIYRNAGVWANGAVRAEAPPKVPDIVANLNLKQDWGQAQIMGALHQVRSRRGPENQQGWAIGAGAVINLPMLGPGDRIGLQGGFSQGALRYLARAPVGPTTADGVYTGRRLELVDAWAVGGGILHNWTPQWSSAVDASWLTVDAPGPAKSFDNFDLQANLSYKPVKGLLTALEVEWKHVDVDRGQDADGLVGMMRVQREF